MRTCPNCSRRIPANALFCPHCGSSQCGSLAEAESAAIADLEADGEGRFAPGAVLAGRYLIVAPLGRGGMGEVYEAKDLRLRQPVALKFLSRSLAGDAPALNNLYREVRMARQVAHPNVCRVYDIAEADGLHFLIMEHVKGEEIRSLLRRIGPFSASKAAELARQLCFGVAALHERGVIHRDLKPANIMLDGQGDIRIMDFGIAVLRDRKPTYGEISGTPAYMAPEQFVGVPASVRSDLYSMGLVLYEIFGGRNPFESLPGSDLAQTRSQFDPATLTFAAAVPAHVRRGIVRCLARDLQDRPVSATEVAIELSGGDLLATALAAGERFGEGSFRVWRTPAWRKPPPRFTTALSAPGLSIVWPIKRACRAPASQPIFAKSSA